MPNPAAAPVYGLRIELVDSEPPIWRQVCVAASLTLGDLHPILAVVMGWAGNARFTYQAHRQPNPGDSPTAQELLPEMPLMAVLVHPGDTLLYTYNPQQGWLHKVWLEAINPSAMEESLPACLAGEGNCPPEICCGVWGYEELIDRLSDPDAPDYEQLWETVGEGFDPDWFDLKSVNQRLGDL
jgi:hypothetical protein